MNSIGNDASVIILYMFLIVQPRLHLILFLKRGTVLPKAALILWNQLELSIPKTKTNKWKLDNLNMGNIICFASFFHL